MSNCVLFLERNKLSFFDGSIAKSLIVPSEVSSFMSIVDVVAYKKALADFFAEIKTSKGKAILVLDSNLYFDGVFKKNEDPNKLAESFLDKVPIEASSVSKIVLEKKDERVVLVTDRVFYEPIVEELANLKIFVLGVVPVSLLVGVSGASDLEKIWNSFSSINKGLWEISFIDSKRPTNSKKIFGFALFFIVFCLGLTVLYKGLRINQTIKPDTDNASVPMISPTANIPAPAEVAIVDKKDLKITVLNGSGVAGLAGKVKTDLEKSEFLNIETDNADNFDSLPTRVLFKKQVSQVDKMAIMELLQKTFLEVIEEELSGGNVDVQITTGKLR